KRISDGSLPVLIRRARRNKAVTLDLSGKGLTQLPESLGQLTQLQRLDLSRNQLTAVPEALGQLSQLQLLDVRFISSLPVMQGNVYKAWVDSKPVQMVRAGD